MWQRLQSFRHRHQRAEHVLFFSGGFAFDALAVGRIDDTRVLVQQGIYLIVGGALLASLVAWRTRLSTLPPPLRWAAQWFAPALHFMLGTLLNAYALFYIKSASGLTAVLFAVVIAVLLFVNELPWVRRLGPVVLYGLYSFCLTSYFAYLYPVLIGRLRSWMFVLAVLTALVPLAALGRLHHRATGNRRQVLGQALVPSLAVQAALLLLFFAHLVPPVPLSLAEIGIYHDVARDASGAYRLSYRRPPFWRLWASDDQDFQARAGDRIYCYFRLFAPKRFRDEVRVRWAYWESRGAWASSDAVPVAVVGGRVKGFNGYTYKQNWRRGSWRVSVETIDGREIGRRTFTVRDDAEQEGDREFITKVR